MKNKLVIKKKLSQYCDCILRSYTAEVELDNGEWESIGVDLTHNYSEMDKDEWVSWLYSYKLLKLDNGLYVPTTRVVKIFNVKELDKVEQKVHINTSLPTSMEILNKDAMEYDILEEEFRL